jgi:predicted amidohydrolase
MLVKVVAVQSLLGRKLSLEEKIHIFRQRPDFVCLSEYCLIDESIRDFVRAAMMAKENLRYLEELSQEFSTILIGGSIVEAEGDSLFNSSYLIARGKIMGRYRKLNPVSGELERGILPGDKIFTTIIDDIKIGILICADALNIGLFEILGQSNVDIIFIPTTSPYRPSESKSEKHKRDNDIYLKGAEISMAYVVKTCAVGNLFGKPRQGRSLIAAPWGIMNRVNYYSEMTPSILTAVLDIEELRDFRDKRRLQSAATKSPEMPTLYMDRARRGARRAPSE